MPSYDWQALAVRSISDLLTTELAVVKNEIEAKISDRAGQGMPKPIDPHHVTNGLKALVGRGELTLETASTRGGRRIPVYRVSDTHRRQRAVTAAAARKRLLQARYLGWASGTKSGGTGVIGPALESVVHESLVRAAPHGYRLVRPEGGGDIPQLLGAPVPIGPLDNAALLTTLDQQTFMPAGSYWTLIEAKNLRLCIYPIHPELHQLLAKAASLQAAHPTISFVPILVCRRAHYLTFRMGKALGFHVIETRRQYIRPHVVEPDPTHLSEVVEELGYAMEPYDGAVPAMVEQFTRTVPQRAADAAERWAQIAQPCLAYFNALRSDALGWKAREETLDEIAMMAASILDEAQPWRREETYLDVDYYDDI